MCWAADGYERKGLAGLELKLPLTPNDPHFVFTDRSRDLGCGELGRGENGEVGELVVEAAVAAHDNSDVGCTSGDGSGEGDLVVFQPFFVDLDLPVSMTRGDEVHPGQT